ncbi:hypothetical protein [Actinomadura sp. KC216]|uniref:hypothetical protein n=1 Tax=Actinomadura sp. KC216 TaxID=2530370 RepID=UPI001A9CFA98|nr:hypothetical protein [Actinomadura sp. KC216]
MPEAVTVATARSPIGLLPDLFSPVEASRRALAGLSSADVDLGVDEERLNVNGGAMAVERLS